MKEISCIYNHFNYYCYINFKSTKLLIIYKKPPQNFGNYQNISVSLIAFIRVICSFYYHQMQ